MSWQLQKFFLLLICSHSDYSTQIRRKTYRRNRIHVTWNKLNKLHDKPKAIDCMMQIRDNRVNEPLPLILRYLPKIQSKTFLERTIAIKSSMLLFHWADIGDITEVQPWSHVSRFWTFYSSNLVCIHRYRTLLQPVQSLFKCPYQVIVSVDIIKFACAFHISVGRCQST